MGPEKSNDYEGGVTGGVRTAAIPPLPLPTHHSTPKPTPSFLVTLLHFCFLRRLPWKAVGGIFLLSMASRVTSTQVSKRGWLSILSTKTFFQKKKKKKDGLFCLFPSLILSLSYFLYSPSLSALKVEYFRFTLSRVQSSQSCNVYVECWHYEHLWQLPTPALHTVNRSLIPLPSPPFPAF